jgi:GNAT superfamily N-acetyltransferase
MTSKDISLRPAGDADAEELASLRVEAMRESLERVGRFDPVRARTRFLSSFSAAHTRHILRAGRPVGVVVIRPEGDALLLDHLYVHPSEQGNGIGSAVLHMLQAEATVASLPIHVGALKESRSNGFCIRHGFKPLAQGEWDNYYVWYVASGA